MPSAAHRFTLTVALTVAALLAACGRPAPPPEPVRAVRIQVVEPQVSAPSMNFSAEIRARTESPLGFRVPGKLASRRVDVGQTVQPGQVLAELDAQDFRLAAQAAQADLTAAQQRRDQAAADHRRLVALRDQGFISSAQVEQSATALQAAQAQWEQARAQARVQGNQAAYTRLVADVAGVVTAVEAQPGQVLSAGMPVLRLAHDGPRDAVFAVPEDRVDDLRAAVAAGASLQVRLWGEKSSAFPARLREVAAAADPATRTYQIKADVGRASVRLGQTATVVLQAPAVTQAIQLPLSAVFEYQGRSHVWILDEASMTVDRLPVQIGGVDGNAVVIAAGLQAGASVVTAGVHVLNAGQRVRRFEPPGAATAHRDAPAPALGGLR